MKLSQYVFKKTPIHWLCMNPYNDHWFICRQKEPMLVVEFDPETQTGRIVGLGNQVGKRVENCKQYEKELNRALAFTRAYIRKRAQVN